MFSNTLSCIGVVMCIIANCDNVVLDYHEDRCRLCKHAFKEHRDLLRTMSRIDDYIRIIRKYHNKLVNDTPADQFTLSEIRFLTDCGYINKYCDIAVMIEEIYNRIYGNGHSYDYYAHCCDISCGN